MAMHFIFVHRKMVWPSVRLKWPVPLALKVFGPVQSS